MFNAIIGYPCAVVDQGPDGGLKALDWCLDHANNGQRLTLWVPQKSTLNKSRFLKNLSSQSGVNTVFGLDSYIFNADGPALAMYPRVEDLGAIAGSLGITALCVVQWVDSLRIWIQETGAEILTGGGSDDDSFWNAEESSLTPEIVQGLQHIDLMVNCNNTISGGYEKKIVVRQLLKLYDEGIDLPGDAMAEWACIPWLERENCGQLREYAKKINNDIRPRYNA